MFDNLQIADRYEPHAQAVVFPGDCLELLASIPSDSIQLVVTSPPYNLGKEYEKRSTLSQYVAWQTQVITECFRVVKSTGSICWQVGNYVDKGSIVPLDIALYPIFDKLGMQLRNRIVWHFEHGLHSSRRLSGRYETIMWFTKTDQYTFDVDPIRVPQKYPGKKHFKGPHVGEYSGNPLGKNPGDVWIFPNVKNNHIEKTDHPCQFPIELVDRLVLSMTNEQDCVLDPFMGVGSTVASAIRRNRRGVGAEIVKRYVEIALKRIQQALTGTLKVREMGTPVYDPRNAGVALTKVPWTNPNTERPLTAQPALLEDHQPYEIDDENS
jgi:adenine-specific DNA-methyltransferase